MALYTNENGIKDQQDAKESLRAELKLWERAFEKENGHKPTPGDIKANSEISAKYKLYHKAFRPKPSSKSDKSMTKTEYVSTAKALKQITPQKRPRDYDILTPVKSVQMGDSTEMVGPTPQLNGRILGLFDGIQDQTPLTKRMKSNWGEQLAEARKNSPRKSTPRKRVLNGFIEPESPMLTTPTKSTSSSRSRFTTPVTNRSATLDQHAFATPAFLRPTALPVQSPESPSLPWERIPSKIKGLSALISDFRANQQTTVEQMDCEAWEDEDDLKVTDEHESPGVAGRKPWMKKGAKRSKRRVIMRPVPQLEIAPSDDEVDQPQSPTTQKAHPRDLARASPELGDEHLDDSQFQDEEEPSDLDEARAEAKKAEKPASTKGKKAKVQTTRKAKGGYKIGKQVSGNFVSYKIRSKGQRGRGRFGGGRFGRR